MFIHDKESERSCKRVAEKVRRAGQRKAARAWRIKALFSRVAGHQQELDVAGLEIWAPYYHCLHYWRDLHGGKECPLAPLHSQHISVQPLTPPRTHSSHTLTIGLSIFLSLCLACSDILLHIRKREKLLCSTHCWNVLISTIKRCKRSAVLTITTCIKVN